MLHFLPLRFLIPALLLLTTGMFATVYVWHRFNASDVLIETHLGRESSYLGPQLTADFMEAYDSNGLRGGLRQLIRRAARPDIRLTLLIGEGDRLLFVSAPELQGYSLAQMPDPPTAAQIEAARQSMEGFNWRSPEGKTLWGLFPVDMGTTRGAIRGTTRGTLTETSSNDAQPPERGVLALAYDVEKVKAAERQRIQTEIGLFLLGIVFVAVLIWLLLRFAVTKRIEHLAADAHDFVEGQGGFSSEIKGHDEIGNLARDLAQIGRDLHDRYRQLEVINASLEIEVEARRAVEAELQLAASVFASANEGIVITDSHNRIIDVNAAFERVTGYTRAEAIGNTPAMLHSGRQDQAFYANLWDKLKTVGHWQGEIWNRRKNGEIYVEILDITVVRGQSGEVSHHVAVFTDISELKASQSKLEKIAHFDALTSLPNRTLLTIRLEQAMAQAKRQVNCLAVVYMDVDHFKPINDGYGHAMGDLLLVEVARRLEASLRIGDTAARIGGDEFVLLITGINGTEELGALIQRVQANVSQPMHLDGHMFEVTASLGATLFPSDAGDADTLVRHADQAMYLAKQSGRNRYHLFDPEQDRQIHQRYELLEKLSAAIDQNQLEVYYQPKVNLRTGQVYGAEALVRWNDPARGLVMPGAFLPLAENHDVIIALEDWVIEAVLKQMRIWRAEGLDWVVSVNIAARDLQSHDFVDRLQAHLASYPELLDGRLELEILESAALENTAYIRSVIERCREFGVHFSLDDFGTGYASLAYLKEIPVDVLKIDQSFVRDILEDQNDLALVQGVVGLAHAFKRQVVAEGMETPEHGALLLRLGCDNAQGYGIARPMPAGQVKTWLAAFKPDVSWG